MMMFEAAFFVILLVCGYLFGRIAEHRHLKSIIVREKSHASLPAGFGLFQEFHGRLDQHFWWACYPL